MASPQCENGYTKIANEILEALSHTQLSGYQSRCLFFLWRKTYGWEKRSEVIGLAQWCEGTGITKDHMCRTLKELCDRNIVAKIGNEFSFQKDYTRWRALPKMATLPKLAINVAKIGNKPLPKLATINKEHLNKKKEISRDSFGVAEYLLEKILAWKPDLKKPNLGTWAKSIDRMIRLDKRKPDRIRKIIDFATQDDFWQGNILCAGSLREKYDQLDAKARRKENLI